MRVLVTGGAGFIGSHLIDRLLGRNHKVTVLDNLSTGRIENIKERVDEESLVFVNGDIRDRDLVNKCMENQDALIHLAAITSVPFSVANPKETFDVNVTGTENLLRASVENKVRKVIFASSCAVYGEPDYLPTGEEHPWRPISPYAASKADASRLCDEYRKSKGLDTTTFQLFNVYGPGQTNNGYGGVISQFTKQISSNQAPIIFGDGEQTRDFVYVEDAIDLLIKALDADLPGSMYNVGSGNATTVNDLLRTMSRVFGSQARNPMYMPSRTGDIRRSQADIRRVASELGFTPRVGLEDGLRRVVAERSESACH